LTEQALQPCLRLSFFMTPWQWMVRQAFNQRFLEIPRFAWEQCQEAALREQERAECTNQRTENEIVHVNSTYSVLCGGHTTECSCHCPDCVAMHAHVNSNWHCAPCPEWPTLSLRRNHATHHRKEVQVVIPNQTEKIFNTDPGKLSRFPPIICYSHERPVYPPKKLDWEWITLGIILFVSVTNIMTYLITRRQKKARQPRTTTALKVLNTTKTLRANYKNLLFATTLILFVVGEGSSTTTLTDTSPATGPNKHVPDSTSRRIRWGTTPTFWRPTCRYPVRSDTGNVSIPRRKEGMHQDDRK